jgi:hypothetical protein
MRSRKFNSTSQQFLSSDIRFRSIAANAPRTDLPRRAPRAKRSHQARNLSRSAWWRTAGRESPTRGRCSKSSCKHVSVYRSQVAFLFLTLSTYEMEDTPFLISSDPIPVFGRSSFGHVLPGITSFVGICIARCIAFSYPRYGASLHVSANSMTRELCLFSWAYRSHYMYTISDI